MKGISQIRKVTLIKSIKSSKSFHVFPSKFARRCNRMIIYNMKIACELLLTQFLDLGIVE
jgi:hypothetical protein